MVAMKIGAVCCEQRCYVQNKISQVCSLEICTDVSCLEYYGLISFVPPGSICQHLLLLDRPDRMNDNFAPAFGGTATTAAIQFCVDTHK